MRSSWNRRSWRPTTQVPKVNEGPGNKHLFIGVSYPWNDMRADRYCPSGCWDGNGHLYLWSKLANWGNNPVCPITPRVSFTLCSPPRISWQFLLGPQHKRKKKSTLCNKRKYISIMIRKNGLEHTHWFPPPPRSCSAQNLGWLQKSMCTKMSGLGQIPQILFICSWSDLLITRLEFSILLQMELPSP